MARGEAGERALNREWMPSRQCTSSLSPVGEQHRGRMVMGMGAWGVMGCMRCMERMNCLRMGCMKCAGVRLMQSACTNRFYVQTANRSYVRHPPWGETAMDTTPPALEPMPPMKETSSSAWGVEGHRLPDAAPPVQHTGPQRGVIGQAMMGLKASPSACGEGPQAVSPPRLMSLVKDHRQTSHSAHHNLCLW